MLRSFRPGLVGLTAAGLALPLISRADTLAVLIALTCASAALHVILRGRNAPTPLPVAVTLLMILAGVVDTGPTFIQAATTLFVCVAIGLMPKPEIPA